ncbi:MAG: hypothetical protein CL761_05460 [Chloroflexi bacterium]|nr:hypothetical protein [Chloroflexota bacterium]|tara:strand:+ start:3086 stop:3691 length:606 start_codon:yes stop_codon:yes gene_type:complete
MEILIFLIFIFILSSINLSTQYLSNYKNLEFNKNEHLGSSYIWKNHSKFAGLIIFFGDSVIKGFFPIFLSKYILNFNDEYIFLYILITQMIGNNWSIFLKLKGGRGMAIAIGSLLGINIVLALILYVTYISLYFGKFKDGGITWIVSIIFTTVISLGFSMTVFYCYLACIFITLLKRATGNEIKFQSNIIINRIIYDRDIR